MQSAVLIRIQKSIRTSLHMFFSCLILFCKEANAKRAHLLLAHGNKLHGNLYADTGGSGWGGQLISNLSQGVHLLHGGNSGPFWVGIGSTA